MAYYVKKCPACATENHPAETICVRCSTDLPDSKTESDKEPLSRPKLAPKPVIVKSSPPEVPLPTQVVVTDINMKFASMVGFMVKWAIATIPALIILIFIGMLAAAVIGSMYTPRKDLHTEYFKTP